jgi:hypothetical protein
MNYLRSDGNTSRILRLPAHVAIGTAAAALLLLAALHVLSPEFDPAWRMVSEYANGRYGWVLSAMFAAWGVSSWALLLSLRADARSMQVRVGLVFLAIAGAGEAMAAVFDINHDTMHGVAGALGILGLPVAAMLISVSLGRSEQWSQARQTLLWTANLTWISVVLLAATFVLLVVTFSLVAGGPPAQAPRVLPHGVIGLVGWANRLIVVSNCAWVVALAWHTLRMSAATARFARTATRM